MFLVSAAIDREDEFWWDSVERAILRDGDLPARLTVKAGGEERSWQVHSRPRPVLHREVWTFLRGQRPAVRDRAAGELLAWAGLAPEGRSSHRTLTSTELADLAAEDLIEIGAHTRNHAWLAGLEPDEQLEEIAGGRKQLESMVGRSVDAFAYPHGGLDDVPAHAIDTVRRVGFSAAFMGVPNQVRARSDRHALPRVFVEDMDGDEFGRLLWRYGGIRTA
jgi:peptidoglycan/xylan/chitin deacetylase (PgdA/CDA1 family)